MGIKRGKFFYLNVVEKNKCVEICGKKGCLRDYNVFGKYGWWGKDRGNGRRIIGVGRRSLIYRIFCERIIDGF